MAFIQDSTVVETGLSDFHRMYVTVMKMYHCKQRPSVSTYRKFKIFSNIEFMKDLEEHLTKFEHFNSIPSNLFKEIVNTILEKHAPTKKKYVRANQGPFITKTLSKEIMKRSRLRNKFLHTKSDIDRKVYNKQRNYVVSLLRKEKKDFYGNLDISKMTDNRVFGKSLSRKFQIRSKYVLKLLLLKMIKSCPKMLKLLKLLMNILYKYPNFKYTKQSEFLYTNAFS